MANKPIPQGYLEPGLKIFCGLCGFIFLSVASVLNPYLLFCTRLDATRHKSCPRHATIQMRLPCLRPIALGHGVGDHDNVA